MQRVTRATAVAVLPTPPAGGTPGFFAEPDPLGGIPATVPGYEWYNMIQEELMSVVVAAGLEPDANAFDQLLTAIASLISSAMPAIPSLANYALINAINNWTKTQAPVGNALADGAAIDWDCSAIQVARLTLGGNRTVNAPSNVQQNALYLLRITQDATGSRTLSWNAAYKFGTAGAPTLTTTAGKTDLLSFVGGAGNTLEYLGIRQDGV